MGRAARHRVVRHTTAAILLVALAAAVATVAFTHGTETALGTMGMGAVSFLLMWSLMMTAMMLPSVTPVASLYVRSIDRPRVMRGGMFVGGYTVVWGVSGVAAYALAIVADQVIALGGPAPRLFAASVLGASALYYLTPLKYRLLGLCRNPLGLVIQYGQYRGRTRDLRAGLHHGLTCLGCCWPLMALMVVFGAMNVAAMLLLALVVAVEKLAANGVGFAHAVGAVSALLAVLVLFVPEVAAVVVGGTGTQMSM